MNCAIGVDIGGTKCSVSLGKENAGALDFPVMEKFATEGPPSEILERISGAIERILRSNETGNATVAGIGVSCGGPLDSINGVILSPPNLPGWDNIRINEILKDRSGLPVWLCNDADACAVAEWKFGNGRGYRNIVFLTFGTGMGAGLILDGCLYSGTNDMAGECGHIRLSGHGPAGYGKAGSFEGFCSGGGIAQLGYTMAQESIQRGIIPAYCVNGLHANDISAKTVADAAGAGDVTAIEVYRVSGEMLGRGLSVLVDILNPEVIIIGSVFSRSRELLWPHAESVMEKECLRLSYGVCRVVPSGLGEKLGDYAAVTLALYRSGAGG